MSLQIFFGCTCYLGTETVTTPTHSSLVRNEFRNELTLFVLFAILYERFEGHETVSLLDVCK